MVPVTSLPTQAESSVSNKTQCLMLLLLLLLLDMDY
jgi:hypothetical protein